MPSKRQVPLLIVRSSLAESGKALTFTETGMKQNTDPQWWTQTLLPSMEGYPVCFLVTWRNATNDDDECYGIYKGHPSEEDFKRFAQNPHIIFRK